MKEIVNFLVGLVLFLLAWALFLPISFLNFFIVGLKFKDLGYLETWRKLSAQFWAKTKGITRFHLLAKCWYSFLTR